MILTLSAIVNDNFIRSETANEGNVQTGQQDNLRIYFHISIKMDGCNEGSQHMFY